MLEKHFPFTMKFIPVNIKRISISVLEKQVNSIKYSGIGVYPINTLAQKTMPSIMLIVYFFVSLAYSHVF